MMRSCQLTVGQRAVAATTAKRFASSGRPADAVKKVGLIGIGTMGSGIAHSFARKNIPIGVKEVKADAAARGVGFVQKELNRDVEKGNFATADVAAKLQCVTTGATDEVLRGADIVIEAAVEVMDVKKKIIQQLEEEGIITGKNIYASNTSSLSLTEMQNMSKYPENIVGMHFFNPVPDMPLVEVVMGAKTSRKVAETVYDLAVKTDKKPILVQDGPGFVVNRMLGAYVSESVTLTTEDHCDPARVEKALERFGMMAGGLGMIDLVGADIAVYVSDILAKNLHSKVYTVGDTGVRQMVADGNLGHKNKRGFFTYNAKDERGELNPEMVRKYLSADLSCTTITDHEIVDRCILLIVNVGATILAEGKAQCPADLDLGLNYGIGFPVARDGLMAYADDRGIPNVVKRLQELQAKTGKAYFAPCETLVKMAKENKRFYPDRPVKRHDNPESFYS